MVIKGDDDGIDPTNATHAGHDCFANDLEMLVLGQSLGAWVLISGNCRVRYREVGIEFLEQARIHQQGDSFAGSDREVALARPADPMAEEEFIARSGPNRTMGR